MLESAFSREDLPPNYIWTLGYIGEWSDPRTADISAQVKSYGREWLQERHKTLESKRKLLRDQQLELKRLQAAKESERKKLTEDKFKDMDAIKRTIAASPVDMLKGVAKGAVDLATGGVTDPKERLAICEKCPFFGDDKRCGRCGCFVPAKARVKKSTCPVGAWARQES